jgi:hypothetical protein
MLGKMASFSFADTSQNCFKTPFFLDDQGTAL